jgi:hypothetical protein
MKNVSEKVVVTPHWGVRNDAARFDPQAGVLNFEHARLFHLKAVSD